MTLWRYYFRGMNLGYAVAAGALLAMFFLFDLISEAESVGAGEYSFADAAAVVLLKLPSRFVELSPVVAMLGVTYALAVFGRNLELVAIRTTGVSVARLVLGAVGSVVVLYVVVGLVELVARPLHQTALSFRTLQVAEQGQPVRGDLWIADPAGMVRISDWGAGLAPKNVEIFVFGADKKLERYLRAAEVTVEADGLWRLTDADVTHFSAQRTESRRLQEVTWRPEAYRNLSLFDLPATGLSLSELRVEIARRQQNGEDAGAARLEFWKRCFLPLSGMVFAAFAGAVGVREGERGGVGRQLAIGVLVALVLYLGQQITLNAALVAGSGPLLAAGLPIFGVGLLAVFVLRRAA
jgi:lipopolysaccharide export system permease protein